MLIVKNKTLVRGEGTKRALLSKFKIEKAGKLYLIFYEITRKDL